MQDHGPRSKGGSIVSFVQSGHSTFADPELYQAAINPAHVEILVTAKGDFRASLTRIELPRLWLQYGRESLPRIANSIANAERPPIFFLTGAEQAPISHNGRDLAYGEMVIAGSGSMRHHRSEGPCQWAALSLTRDDLAVSCRALVGRDLIDRSTTHYLRPTPSVMSQLLNLQQAADQLAHGAANTLAQPEPARALEQAFVHTIVTCLSEGVAIKLGRSAVGHTAVMARFEELLAVNYDQPLHLAEICAAIGASERTLRTICIENLGMGPIRYLWLRRMHLARRALIQATPQTATVTEIATANGFWELGRFAVEYRALFGEAPSASLHRPAQEVSASKNGPFALATSEYA
jgi:AraC-like DNA-binding protein